MGKEEKEGQKIHQTQERFWRRLTTLLTILGLWLALPATCGLFQRIVDNLTQLDPFFSTTVAITTKIISDSCLMIIYIVGLVTLVIIGFTTFIAANAIDTLTDSLRAMVNDPTLKDRLTNTKDRATNWFHDLLEKFKRKLKKPSSEKKVDEQET